MMPDADYVFCKEDTLMIMGKNENLKALIK